MKNSDNISIFESYRQHKTVHYYLTEQEAQEAQIKQKLQSAMSSQETQDAIINNAENLFAKYKKRIDAAKIKGEEAVDSLLKEIQAEQNIQLRKESWELQEEGWWDRLVSRGSGALRQGQELMKGGSAPTKGFDTHKVLKRFEILQKTIGKDLRELERDMGTSSNKDDTVKQQVSQMIKTLGSEHDINPVQSKLSDFRHKAGVLGQNIVTGAVLGAGVLAIAAPIIATLGITGPAAAAVGAGVSAASTSALKDLIYGQKPNAKRAIVAGVLAATAAGFLRYYLDNASSGIGKAAPTEPTVTTTTPDVPVAKPIMPDTGKIMHNDPTWNPVGEIGKGVDVTKETVSKILWDKGIIGSSKGVALPSPAVQKYLDTLIQNPETRDKAVDLLNKLKDTDPERARKIFSYTARQAGNIGKLFAKL